MSEPKLLEGKVFVVTGGGRGVGRAQCLVLAKLGARVLVNDVGCDAEGHESNAAVVDSMVADLRAAGGEAIGDAGDIVDPATAPRLIARATQEFGPVDGVVHNAGISRNRGLLKMTLDDLEAPWRVQVAGAFHLLQAAAASMVADQRPGSVVLATGPGAFFGTARQANTTSAAAAVAGLVRSAAVELRRHNIRVNAVAPTARTRQTEALPLFRGIGPDSMAPEHVAPMVAFLLSELSKDVHGEVLGVAGPRAYAFQGRETTGAFVEGGMFTPSAILDAWDEITRS